MRVLVVVLAAAGLMLLTASAAAGHARLVSTSPADGQRLVTAPDTVTVTFDEPVTGPEGALRVFDPRGQRVDEADAHVVAESPDTILASLRGDLRDGTYVVTWRAISADGHPVRGALVFAVGDETAIDESLLAQILVGEDERAVAVAATIARGLLYAATLLAAGAAGFFLLAADPGLAAERRLARIGAVAAAAGVILTVVGVPLQTALETGLGVEAFARGDLLLTTLSGGFGLSALVRVVGLITVALALWRLASRSRVFAAGTGGALTLASFLLVGHTVTSEPRLLVVTADALHLLTGAVWFGGLVLLAVYLRRPDDDPVLAAETVSRFSRVAVVAVLLVAASGLTLAWVEVRALRALLTTAYGTTLTVKVALGAVVVALGVYNNRRLVPAVRTAAVPAGGSATDRPPIRLDGPWLRLRRTVQIEAAVLVPVLLVTGALVYLQPAREAAGVTGPFSVYADIGEQYEVNLVVDPNRAGRNELHLYVLDRQTFRPLSPLAGAELHLEISMPAEDIGPLVREPHVAGPGHWLRVGSELAFRGTWEVVVVVRLDEFQEIRATVPVPVNP